jgi:predicted enzyme related to lactoylglutathione lyase
MNNIIYFEIQSSEPSREIKFYETVFGWKFTKEEFAPIEYYSISTEGINGGLMKRLAEVPSAEMGTNAYTCSAEVDDFDRTSELILKNGGQVALPKFAIPGKCWQGYFTDADNNVFGLVEVDANAK